MVDTRMVVMLLGVDASYGPGVDGIEYSNFQVPKYFDAADIIGIDSKRHKTR